MGYAIASVALLQYIGYLSIHYHRIETDLRKIPGFWTAYPGPGNLTNCTAPASQQDASRRRYLRWPLRRLAASPLALSADQETAPSGDAGSGTAWRFSRVRASSLTASAASFSFVFGIRHGYMMRLAIPKMYWQRPGRIVAG